jgi:hypothetical protein
VTKLLRHLPTPLNVRNLKRGVGRFLPHCDSEETFVTP